MSESKDKSEEKQPVMRSVLIFPHFETEEAVHRIEHVRGMYDPAYAKVQPHLTLVFPFPSAYSADEIRDGVSQCTTGVHPFKLVLKDIVVKNTFIFMLPSEGSESIKRLFNALHSGLFEPFRPSVLEKEPFMPHMTLGTCSPETAVDRLFLIRSLLKESYTAFVDTISVEIIGENSNSIIESEIALF